MAGGAAAPSGAKPKPQQPKKQKAKLKHKIKQKQKAPKPLKQEVSKLDKQVKNLKRRTDGPKTNDMMKTTVTVGTLSGQTNSGLNRQLRVPLNPLLMKMSEGTTTTPLSIRASMYELWRIQYLEVVATPLTGFSGVCGSVGFMVLTLNGLEASAESIDTVKARKHVQMPLGRLSKLRVAARELEGPRTGWWLVDTSQSPADSYGPAIDLMLAYETQNLLNTTSGTTATYSGPLWQVEMRVVYHFSTYHPKPGLQSLVSQTLQNSETVTITTSQEDGSLVMQVTDAQLLNILSPRTETGRKGKSQTVWAIAGAAVDAAAGVLGPWGWLLKGGFWLVRKIFGGTSARTGATYQIYPSIEQAMSDQPIFGDPSGQQQVTIPIVHVSEVMNPNPESNDFGTPTLASGPAVNSLVPFRPDLQPTPVYQTPNDPGYSRTTQAAYLTGNWTWSQKLQTSGMWIGANSDHKSVWNYVAFAAFTDDQVQFMGVDNRTLLGPGGAVGTARTWQRSWAQIWSNIEQWRPSSISWVVQQPQLPAEAKALFSLQGPVLVIKGAALAPPPTDYMVGDRNQLGSTAWLFISQQGGGGVAVTSKSPNEAPTRLDLLSQPILIQANPSSTWRDYGLNPCPSGPPTIQLEPDDDDISLADSCFNEECEGVDSLEHEREQLLQRLRALDLQRFHTG
uniref:Capsid protein n=1 Tax=Wood pigeon astrovirus TaxID=928292 RepID=F6IA20_9VIRU|nr:capsid protein precursor [Wood pigeon astrovirus]